MACAVADGGRRLWADEDVIGHRRPTVLTSLVSSAVDVCDENRNSTRAEPVGKKTDLNQLKRRQSTSSVVVESTSLDDKRQRRRKRCPPFRPWTPEPLTSTTAESRLRISNLDDKDELQKQPSTPDLAIEPIPSSSKDDPKAHDENSCSNRLQPEQADNERLSAESAADDSQSKAGTSSKSPRPRGGSVCSSLSQQQMTRRNYKNMTRERRIEANARERTRVHTISAAFENLRKSVPAYSHNQKLSKLAVLRLAASYILTLARLLEMDYSSDNSSPSLQNCIQSISNTIQMEGRLKKRKDEQSD
ncbi:Helix-loop-helix DNA-Hypothetical protein domain [Nesidiocoris tenuis]|uniref:BHLH domain-containing protein n=1 Tax=Nesidiocoris tenuis TaxID=355587 RepID=A0ABN7AL13_9HEMI|nr:Helix-loop-helix DNA-Hypothetical protein domain [Nesidiocoris tenuis]